ncbi:MAG: hypothetical protein L6Q92_01530 [Phycisphaerae bacterium]|nr:hypothetical protein [Phycisphaerae bacterium]
MRRRCARIRRSAWMTLPAATALLSVHATTSFADTTTIDFDNLANGTVVTTQYDGVAFSTAGNSCGGDPVVQAIIVTPAGGTSSGTRALSLQTGCPDFSPDRLVMTFDESHAEVSFNLGAYPGTYEVKAYSLPVGGAATVFQTIVLNGAGAVGVHRFVRVQRPVDMDIRRIEIRETVGLFEYIDDLTFDCIDSTYPTAAITTPAALACVCNSSVIQGSAYDADGAISLWKLERKAPSAGTWTLIRQTSTPVIDGDLATWTTAAATGWYILRLTVTNACGLTTTVTTVVWLDKSFDSIDVRSPTPGAVVGGTVCVDGTVWDFCGGTLNLEYRALPTGAFVGFPDVQPPWVVNDPLGSWNASAKPDGNYEIRVSASDDCGNSASSVTIPIVIDNTPPTAVISSPANCDFVDGIVSVTGTVNDAHLGSWSLSYTGGNANGWVPLAGGVAPVVNGLLWNWDTTGLARCAYTLRLSVVDQAVVNCDDPHVNETFVTVNLGSCCDLNRDGSSDGLDAQTLVDCLLIGDACP